MENKLVSLLKGGAITLPQKEIGLFTGKMGICLALYITNKDANDKETSDLADKMLNEIINDLPTETRLTFDNGLIGIGLAINFLITHGFVEGCADDVLYNIDAALYKELKDHRIKHGVDCGTGLIGFLIYIVNRLQNHKQKCNATLYELNSASLRAIINSLDEAMPATFSYLSKDLYTSILWNYPLLFIYLKKALALDIYNDKIINTLKVWTFYINAYSPIYNTNKLYLAVSLAYLNKVMKSPNIEKQIKNLLFAIDLEELYHEIDPKIMDINEGWFFIAMVLKAAEEIFQETIYKEPFKNLRIKIQENYTQLYEDFIEKRKNKKGSLDPTLIHGIAGIEIIESLRIHLFE